MCFYTSSVPDPSKCIVCGREEADEVMQDGKVILYVCSSCGYTWVSAALKETRRTFFSMSPPDPPPPIPPAPPLPELEQSDFEQRVAALAGMGMVEPVLSELAELKWATPEYLEEWDRLIWNEKGNLGLGLVVMNIQMGVRAAVARMRNGSLYVGRWPAPPPPIPQIAFRVGYIPVPFVGDGGPGIVPYDPAHWRRVEGET